MAELNFAEELNIELRDSWSTDVMTGGSERKMHLYYQLIQSLQKAKSVDILVSFFDGIRCKNAPSGIRQRIEQGSKGSYFDW